MADHDDLKALVDKGNTLLGAARQLGMAEGTARRLAKVHGIKAHPAAVRAACSQNFSTRAAKANQNVFRAGYWALCKRHPIPTEDEAQKAVEEFLRTRSVTTCPVAAAAPVNNGEGFR